MPALNKSLLHKLRVCLFSFLPITPQDPDLPYDNNWGSRKTTGNYAGKAAIYNGWGFNYNKDFDDGNGGNVYYQLNCGRLKNALLPEEKAELLNFLDSINTISISIVVQKMHTIHGRGNTTRPRGQQGTYRLTPLDLGSVWTMMGAKGDTRLNRDNAQGGTAAGTKSPGGTQVITQVTEPSQTEVLPAINTASGGVGPYLSGHRAGGGYPSILNSDRSSKVFYSDSNNGGSQLPTTKVKKLADLPTASSTYYIIPDTINSLFDCGFYDTALVSYAQKMLVVSSIDRSTGVGIYQTHIDIPKATFINAINNGTTISGSLIFPILIYAKHKLNKNKSPLADSFNYTVALIFHDFGQGSAHYRPVHMVFDKLRVLDRGDVEHMPGGGGLPGLFTALNGEHPVQHQGIPGLHSNVAGFPSTKQLYVMLPGDGVYKNFNIDWSSNGRLTKKTNIRFQIPLYNGSSAVYIDPWSSSSSGTYVYVTDAQTITGVPPRDEQGTVRIDIGSSINTDYALPGLQFSE